MQVMEPKVELHGTGLYERLRLLSTDHAERITKFLSEIAPILQTTAQYFPYYTRHDAHHGYRVVRRIEQVIRPECLKGGKASTLGATENLPSDCFSLCA